MAKEFATREPSTYIKRRSNVEGLPINLQRESLYTENIYQTINNIHVDNLFPYEKQARTLFDEERLQELAKTIREHGVRQPLTVLPVEGSEGHFEVISGERRLRAAKIAGLTRVPCIIVHDPKAARELSLIENLQREDLHPIEEGMAYKSLLDEGIYASQFEISQSLSVAKSQISELIKFASLPKAICQELIDKKIFKRSVLRKIVSASCENDMWAVLKGEYKVSLPAASSVRMRINQSKLLEIKLVGDRFEIKRGSTQYIRSDLLDLLRQKLMHIVEELKASQE